MNECIFKNSISSNKELSLSFKNSRFAEFKYIFSQKLEKQWEIGGDAVPQTDMKCNTF